MYLLRLQQPAPQRTQVGHLTSGSWRGFFMGGGIRAFLSFAGNGPLESARFTILVMAAAISSTQSPKKFVGIGSKECIFNADFLMTLVTSSTVAEVKVDK